MGLLANYLDPACPFTASLLVSIAPTFSHLYHYVLTRSGEFQPQRISKVGYPRRFQRACAQPPEMILTALF